ncbi:MAG: dethiobiotin synthase [Candidatus Omnitrophica bacterium]|nr:dethiobiotin synthase [Candidatus Omnitrophota bacterium]
MSRGIFITGTDTGVGKTVVSGLLAHYILARAGSVITQKWVETGAVGLSRDVQTHLKFMGKGRGYLGPYLKHVSSYTFRYPSSPHLAASLEGRSISIEKIKEGHKILRDGFEYVLVEGVGGALVPLNGKTLVADVARELDLPAILVVGNRLGAINHTLLSIECLESRNIKILGVVFNNFKGTSRLILSDNSRITKRISGVDVLGTLTYAKESKALYKGFAPIGKKILMKLKRA